jgi:hypothetical protein
VLNKRPAKSGKKQGSRFKKGQSGNPSGRPQGSRNKVTLAMDALLDGEAENLTRKAMELALGGDITALRLCLDRLCPPRKDRPISMEMPEIKGAKDILLASGVVVAAVASGEITPTEGQALAGVIEAHRRAIETEEIDKRLTALEGTANERTAKH